MKRAAPIFVCLIPALLFQFCWLLKHEVIKNRNVRIENLYTHPLKPKKLKISLIVQLVPIQTDIQTNFNWNSTFF